MESENPRKSKGQRQESKIRRLSAEMPARPPNDVLLFIFDFCLLLFDFLGFSGFDFPVTLLQLAAVCPHHMCGLAQAGQQLEL